MARQLSIRLSISDFEGQRPRRLVFALADRDVHRRVRRMQPAMRQQIDRPIARSVVWQVKLNEMIARHALVLPSAKGVEVDVVQRSES